MEFKKSRYFYHIIAPFFRILIIYIIGYFLVVAAFAFLYKNYGTVSTIKIENGFVSYVEAQKTWEFFHFSLSTQSTLGYGDYTPKGKLASFLAAGQSFLGLILTAIALGYALSRVVRPKPIIKLTKNIAHNPETKTLHFRIWNKGYDHYINIKVRLEIARWVKLKDVIPPLNIHFPVKLVTFSNDLPPSSMMRAHSSNETHKGITTIRSHIELKQDEDNEVLATGLHKNDYLVFYFSGTSSFFGDHVTMIKYYSIDKIICGVYEAPYYIKKTRGLLKRSPHEMNFNRINPFQNKCQNCSIIKHCPLNNAFSHREIHSVEFSDISNPKPIELFK